jgi:hypothetical protein
MAVLVAVGSTESQSLIKDKKLTMRPVIGGFILGIFLYAFGMMNARLGRLIAILVIVGALTFNGTALFEAITGTKTAVAFRRPNFQQTQQV